MRPRSRSANARAIDAFHYASKLAPRATGYEHDSDNVASQGERVDDPRRGSQQDVRPESGRFWHRPA